MSFQIHMVKNLSENNALTKQLQHIAYATVTLLDETSLIDPTFVIAGTGSYDLSKFTLCNYVECDTFNRKYFVRNITSIRANVFALQCHVDVLSSFAGQIRNHKAIIRRQENIYNLYLNDGSLKTYQNPEIVTKQFPSGFSSTKEFVLVVAGG